MTNITIEDLKQTSKLWCDKKEKKYLEQTSFSIKTNIILNNLYYTRMEGIFHLLKDDNYYYKKIYDDLKTNGWNNKYPARIGIGNRGEIFIHGGNHRMNLLTKLNIDCVIFKFVYQTNIKTKVPKLLKTGENFYPYGLLPKWKKK